MTFIVFLVLGGLLVIGLSIMLRARHRRSGAHVERVCPRCRSKQRRRAKFCARCGEALK